ncbi:MAG: hypothetical protein ACYC35_27985 [Pirellulales bacterium]
MENAVYGSRGGKATLAGIVANDARDHLRELAEFERRQAAIAKLPAAKAAVQRRLLEIDLQRNRDSRRALSRIMSRLSM